MPGAAGSLGFMLHASRDNHSQVLRSIFAVWVLSPFLAAGLANVLSKRWPALGPGALNAAVLVLAPGSLATYGAVACGHAGVKAGFVFLMVPMVSWLLIAAVVAMTMLRSGRRPRRGDGG